MSRVIFAAGEQRKFIKEVKAETGLTWEELGKRCGVSSRTIRDWRREKYRASHKTCRKLSKLSGVRLPAILEIREEHWSIHKAAMIKNLFYGPPLATLETRRKGGLISQRRRREDPECYRGLGCIVRNDYRKPDPSVDLAEVVGIILGDGGITRTQLTVTLNNIADAEYSAFVTNLFTRVFGKQPGVSRNSEKNTLSIRLTGINLIKILEEIGLSRGSKIANQVDVPLWIEENFDFSKVCMRGLMDTDGCLYFHNHKVKGKRYLNLGFLFTNHSQPLVRFFATVLSELDLNFKVRDGDTRLFIYSLEDIKRYFDIIGSNNPRNSDKLRVYLEGSHSLA